MHKECLDAMREGKGRPFEPLFCIVRGKRIAASIVADVAASAASGRGRGDTHDGNEGGKTLFRDFPSAPLSSGVRRRKESSAWQSLTEMEPLVCARSSSSKSQAGEGERDEGGEGGPRPALLSAQAGGKTSEASQPASEREERRMERRYLIGRRVNDGRRRRLTSVKGRVDILQAKL